MSERNIRLLHITEQRIRELEAQNAKLKTQLSTLQREFDIVDSACDFWKQTAIELGYEE